MNIEDEIEDLLKEIEDTPIKQTCSFPIESPTKRCNLLDPLKCKLKCLHCDLKVVAYRDKSWIQDDSLYFRNNYPELIKGTRTAQGKVAVSCQCMWFTDTITNEFKSRKVRWICTGHIPFN